MNVSFRKKGFAIIIAFTLLVSLLPINAHAVAPHQCPNGTHQPGDTLYPANWNNQTGGYGNDYYICTVCNRACDANGASEVFVDASNGCSGGYKCHVPGSPYTTACNATTGFFYCTGCNQIVDANGTIADISTLNGHTPGTTQQPADYLPCTGGYQSPYYVCTVCGERCDANGNGAVYTNGTGIHRPGTTLYPADWNSQTGGYVYDYYKCEDCGWGCDVNGFSEMFVGPSSGNSTQHTPGSEKHEANYTACNGGFKTDWYECTACGQPVDASGNLVQFYEPTASHTPGSEKHEANYTACNGGFKTDWYECATCGQPVDENGNILEYTEGTDAHHIEMVPEKAPTYEEPGHITFWQCSVCHAAFLDAQGTTIIENEADILVPQLEKPEETPYPEISIGLQAVPQSVADKYPTVESIYKALINTAVKADADIGADNIGSMLLDVSLVIQNADGTTTTVSPENFPADGVEVLLPYPEGTNQDFTFVITHLITSGSHVGEIEVLQGVPEKDGIRVRFTSMSPVCIVYQKAETQPVTDVKQTSTSISNATLPQTGDTSNPFLWAGAFLCSGILLICLALKKKKYCLH